jgi:molybdenum cofactor cytidylyltransferase
MPSMPRIVVLAAGFSARLGKPKVLAQVRGTSLIRQTVQALLPLTCAPIIVVVPPRASRIRAELRGYPVTFVQNRARARGLSTSVLHGLRLARYSAAALLLPVDLALLKRREIARLVVRWCGARRCVVARNIGGRPGAPLILPRRLFGRALHVGGDSGLKELVRELPSGTLVLVNVPSAGFDVDTRLDLERARRRRGARTP